MSDIRANTISAANGTDPAALTKQWAAKATWSYDQTVPSVEDADNVSSITDNSAGSLTVNWTNSFGSALYRIAGFCPAAPSTAGYFVCFNSGDSRATGSLQLTTEAASTSNVDTKSTAAIFGDLA